MMHWTRSGDLIVMVVLGGMGSSFGPLIGAVDLAGAGGDCCCPHARPRAVLGRILAVMLGPLLLVVVLFARGGIDGLLEAECRRG